MNGESKNNVAAKSVLITGSSAGIGRESVLAFQRAGWKVVATMRSPEKEDELTKLDNVFCVKLDVTDASSIAEAVRAGIAHFGQIDVVVNNAGYGLVGLFEGATDEQIARQFETNVFGLMNVTRALLPHFKARGAGKIVNVASMGGRLTVPLHSLYHATKWAVEGFSEALRFELKPQGIDVKIIEPGAIRTDFYSRSQDSIEVKDLAPQLREFVSVVSKNSNNFGARGTHPSVVANVIVQAAGDNSSRLRYVVGKDAKALLFLRGLLPHAAYEWLIRAAITR